MQILHLIIAEVFSMRMKQSYWILVIGALVLNRNTLIYFILQREIVNCACIIAYALDAWNIPLDHCIDLCICATKGGMRHCKNSLNVFVLEWICIWTFRQMFVFIREGCLFVIGFMILLGNHQTIIKYLKK